MNGPARTLRICLVCTGNTCRSPMAAGILAGLLAERGWTNVQIESGGLHALPGAPATDHAIAVSREHNIDIGQHRARPFDRDRADQCDLILTLSGEHLHRIASWDDAIAERTFLLKAFPAAGDPGPEAWVRDPIGQGPDAYRATFLELDEVLRRIMPEIARRAGGE